MVQPIPINQLTAQPSDKEIGSELASLGLRCLAAREMVPGAAEAQKLDQENSNRLKEMLPQMGGWPTLSRFGLEAARGAWLVAIYADHDPAFQAACLRQMNLLPANEVDRVDRAYLEDRVRLNGGGQQLYGTIWSAVENFATKNYDLIPSRLEDPERVDERRAKVGLPPLAVQEQAMRTALLESEQRAAGQPANPSSPVGQTP